MTLVFDANIGAQGLRVRIHKHKNGCTMVLHRRGLIAPTLRPEEFVLLGKALQIAGNGLLQGECKEIAANLTTIRTDLTKLNGHNRQIQP